MISIFLFTQELTVKVHWTSKYKMEYTLVSQISTLPEIQKLIRKDLASLVVKERKFAHKHCCFMFDWSWENDEDDFQRCRKNNDDLRGSSCLGCKIWICDRHKDEMIFCSKCGTKLVHDNH